MVLRNVLKNEFGFMYFCHRGIGWPFYFYFLNVYSFIYFDREREYKQGRGRERGRKKIPGTMRSWPEPKSKVRCSTDRTTQAPQDDHFILKWHCDWISGKGIVTLSFVCRKNVLWGSLERNLSGKKRGKAGVAEKVNLQHSPGADLANPKGALPLKRSVNIACPCPMPITIIQKW